jgi:hypothetical protein
MPSCAASDPRYPLSILWRRQSASSTEGRRDGHASEFEADEVVVYLIMGLAMAGEFWLVVNAPMMPG